MGCDESIGDFKNAHVYNEKRRAWMLAWNPGAVTVEARERNRVIEHIAYLGGTPEDWDITRMSTGLWKATAPR